MGSFVAIDIAADGTEYASWRRPVRAYFRRQPDGWKLVGLEREPDGKAPQVASRR
jgi:ketosteroid isomerase-like protein